MIICATYENMTEAGDAFLAHFTLRHKCFVDRLHYDASSDSKVRSYKQMEYDQYDTPAAVYLVYVSPQGAAWGCSRLTPVMQGCMIIDLWPQLVRDPSAILAHGVWEGTRFCVDQTLPTQLRQQIRRELVLAYLEIGLHFGMEKIIGVMPPAILKRVFGDSGCVFENLGPPLRLTSGEVISAGCMAVNAEALARARTKTGLHDSVIDYPQLSRPLRIAA